MRCGFRALVVVALLCCFLTQIPAQTYIRTNGTKERVSEMRSAIERYTVDRGSLTRSYPVSVSPWRRGRFKKFYNEWLSSLQSLDFDSMSQDGKIDYLLFKNHLEYELRQLDIQARQISEIELIVPFATKIIDLEEARRRMEPIDSAKTAAMLNDLRKQVDDQRRTIERNTDIKKTVANRAAVAINNLRNNLRNWYTFYNGYDPMFTWWNEEPYKALDQSMTSYATYITEKIVGIRSESSSQTTAGQNRGPGGGGQRPYSATARPGDSSDIVGDPIGREALLSELRSEMIPYTPEELIAIGEKEMAWCENEMKKASRDLGYGDDWHKALEHVKNLYVEPGKQPQMIRDLALEAIKFVEDHDLVTVPELAKETWRMEMMTPERQLVSPFFLGGETILVSFPTNSMAHEQKMMSMRGNNIYFSRATVHHELIPGHHLQGFMAARNKPYRAIFGTPFWSEGNSLYWELLLWDLGF
ncbi:MAG TPA: DUF885 family protein, partial [Pyrinomonadaceae bacterium]|nr:DUF885 family protein [Pyrinomonadaceae bacterium]